MILHNMTQNNVVICIKEESTSETRDITLGGNSYLMIDSGYSCTNYDTLHAENKIELIEEETPVVEGPTSSINELANKIYEIIQGSTLQGLPGVSIIGSHINEGNDLILELSNGTSINAGTIFDQDFLTEEVDPNVPAWAKSSTKPTYDASEITELDTLINSTIENNSTIDNLDILTAESDFKSSSTLTAFNNSFDYLCIETLEDTEDIDSEIDDGQSVITNYYNPNSRSIEKTSDNTLTIQSNTFSLDTVPYNAWISLDYEGTGTVTPYFSKNNGTSWTELTNNFIVSVGVSLTRNIRIKLVLSGIVTLKNIAWGCK